MFLYFLDFFAIFLGIFFPGLGRNGIRDENFFFSLSQLAQPGFDRNNARMKFFNFFYFFLLFYLGNFLSRVGKERNSGQNFFSLFLGLSQLSSDRNIAKMKFFNFLNFWAVFFFLRIFLPGSGRNEIRDKIFFFHFTGQSQLDLDRNIAGRMFFNFLNFFYPFLGNFLAQVRQERNWGQNFFFLSYSANLDPIWIEIMPE